MSKKDVHFIGIGGYGMSGIARVLMEMGYRVSGSDLRATGITRALEEMGATIYHGHDKNNLKDPDMVVVSTAIPEDNPEICEAKRKGIPIMHRSEMLATLINSRFGIAVAGAHGKTTTTSMIALILENAGMDPTIVVGGELPEIHGNAKLGEGQYVVAEACESDRSFLNYSPRIAVLTNIEADHLEHYGGRLENLVETYAKFLQRAGTNGLGVFCFDDERVRELARDFPGRVVSYGIDSEVQYRAESIKTEPGSTRFTVIVDDDKLGEIELAIPGRHNVYNALAAVAVADNLGVPFTTIASTLKTFHGAKRRYQVIGSINGITVIDDYAHHPTELAATIRAARSQLSANGRVIAVFQPQRYTRTKFLLEEFKDSFAEADLAVITEIYSAGEQPLRGISGKVLAEKVAKTGSVDVKYIADKDEITAFLLPLVRPGDLVLMMGAGDIYKTAREFADKLRQKQNTA